MLHVELGGRLADLGQLDAVVTTLGKAVQLDPGPARGHYALDVALLSVPRVDQAIEQLQAALHISPDLANAHYNLGVARFMAGEPDRSVAHVRESIRPAPEDPLAYGFLATVLRELGDAPGGRAAVQRAERLQGQQKMIAGERP